MRINNSLHPVRELFPPGLNSSLENSTILRSNDPIIGIITSAVVVVPTRYGNRTGIVQEISPMRCVLRRFQHRRGATRFIRNHKNALTFQFAQEKTKRKEELKCLGFFKVFERGRSEEFSVFITPGASQGFYPPQYSC